MLKSDMDNAAALFGTAGERRIPFLDLLALALHVTASLLV